MNAIRRSPPLGTTSDGTPNLIKSATIDEMEFTQKPDFMQPDVGPGRIIRTHFLRDSEWPHLDNAGQRVEAV
jgi:hypothetical protein